MQNLALCVYTKTVFLLSVGFFGKMPLFESHGHWHVRGRRWKTILATDAFYEMTYAPIKRQRQKCNHIYISKMLFVCRVPCVPMVGPTFSGGFLLDHLAVHFLTKTKAHKRQLRTKEQQYNNN